MAVRIRLKRTGAKKAPRYRIVVADAHTRRDGRDIDMIGWINPTAEPAEVFVNKEKALEWLRVGAQPSQTVHSILSKEGVMKAFHEEKAAKKAEK